jgi:Acetyltransferase (GNAT) family.
VDEIWSIIESSKHSSFTYSNHDYIRPLRKDGKVIGILVADLKADIPKYDIPVLHTLHVREGHRHEGIGTRLINEFAEDVDTDRILVDTDKYDFYDQVEPEAIHMKGDSRRNRG